MNPHTPLLSTSMVAVCHRCSYRAADLTLTACPVCDFALILEADATGAGGLAVPEAAPAPARAPLPGVDTQLRPVQRRALARRCRHLAPPERAGGTTVHAGSGGLVGRVQSRIAMAVVSAAVAATLAVFLQGGAG